MLTIKNVHLCTRLEVWEPRWKDRTALISVRKVKASSPMVIITFPKAKSMTGQRYAMSRKQLMSYPIESGKGGWENYAVPVADLQSYQSVDELWQILEGWWPELKITKE